MSEKTNNETEIPVTAEGGESFVVCNCGKKYKIDFNDPIKCDCGHCLRFSKRRPDGTGTARIKKIPNDVDHEYTSERICPVCGAEFGDSWEADDEGEEDCYDCGTTFTYTRNVEVTYSTDIKDNKEISK